MLACFFFVPTIVVVVVVIVVIVVVSHPTVWRRSVSEYFTARVIRSRLLSSLSASVHSYPDRILRFRSPSFFRCLVAQSPPVAARAPPDFCGPFRLFLLPVRVIKENFGIKHGCITTVHNVTATQVRSAYPPLQFGYPVRRVGFDGELNFFVPGTLSPHSPHSSYFNQ